MGLKATTDWHGYLLADGRAIHIGQLPGRKSICLYVIGGGALEPLAFFRSTADAQRALDLIDALAGRPSL